MSRWHARFAWLGGEELAADVLFEADEGTLMVVEPRRERPDDAVALDGVVLPGLVNTHSHFFHRALRGRTHETGRDFWAWREDMFAVASVLDPDLARALARATFLEMVTAGITCVGEFHYLHHGPGGHPYQDANEMGLALVDAAEEIGLRIVLLDSCYLAPGFGTEEMSAAQRRFSDGSVDAWGSRVEQLEAALRPRTRASVGAAIHSVRAVDPEQIESISDLSESLDVPCHVHVSEQPAENDACLAATGLTPTQLLARNGALHARTTVVHATHLNLADVRTLGEASVTACLCPTTERDLADGLGPARELADAGVALAVGTDSHAVIDVLDEARGVELHDRLRLGRRGIHAPSSLLRAASASGAAALGSDAGVLAVGRPADFVHVDLDSPRLAGFDPDAGLASVVFAAAATDVRDVVVAGTPVVSDGRHVSGLDPAGELSAAVRRVWAAAA